MQIATTRAVQAYRHTEAYSRSPLELVVMLYDGALRYVRDARAAMDREDPAGRRDAISKALAVVSELQSTLNMAQGGEIAASLDRLYGFVTSRLLDASVQGDRGGLDDAARVLVPLRDAWSQLAGQAAGLMASTP